MQHEAAREAAAVAAGEAAAAEAEVAAAAKRVVQAAAGTARASKERTARASKGPTFDCLSVRALACHLYWPMVEGTNSYGFTMILLI